MRCHLPIGKLVSHPCGRKTRKECMKCSNPTCVDHMSESGRCWSCDGQYQPPEAPIQVSWDEMWDFPDDDARAFDSRSGGPRDGLHELDS